MAPPQRNARGGPQSPPGNRPAEITTTATAKQQDEGTLVLSISGGGRKQQYPRADASLYEPVRGRGRVWLSIRCPHCAGVHLGRVRPGTEPGGVRRTPCGKVWVVVRRRYGTRAEAAA